MLKTTEIDGVLFRQCVKCGKLLPATKEFFEPSKTCKLGIRGRCIECGKEYRKSFYKEYYLTHKEEMDKRSKKYQQENKDKISSQKKQKEIELKKSNPNLYDEIKAQKAEYYKNYMKNNPEQVNKRKERDKKRWENNKDKIREDKRKVRRANRERYNQYFQKAAHKRRAQEKGLEASFTRLDWERALKHFNNSCAYCGAKGNLTKEHFIPVSNGGEYSVNNIIPVCRSCNCSKRDSNFFDWYSKQPFYNRTRELKLLKYLKYSINGKVQQKVLSF